MKINMADQAAHLDTSEIVFSRIIVAIDFSEPASRVLKVAISLCKLFDAKLFLVHASAPVVYGIESEPVAVELIDTNLNVDEKRMQRLVQSEPGLSALRPKVVVAYGEAVDLVSRVATEEGGDLIIVGSHGASGLERLVLGSVAEAVMHQATCPVLIVGPNCKPESYPLRSILFATDLKTTGLRGAQYASGLAERFHAKLTLLHVVTPDSKGSDDRELSMEHARQELARLLPTDIDQYCKTQLLLEPGKPAEIITFVAKAECASVIVVGLRDRVLADHATWSTLSYVIREASCPVLGVRGHLV